MRFQVYCPSFQLGRNELKMVFATYDYLWQLLTPKHRKQIQFVFLERDHRRSSLLTGSCNWRNNTIVIPNNTIKHLSIEQGAGAILFAPIVSPKDLGWLLDLSKWLPILSFNEVGEQLNLSENHGVFIDRLEVCPDGHFAQRMKMLYHDPWALKMLQKNVQTPQKMSLPEWPFGHQEGARA